MRKLIVLALALVCSAPSFAHHPVPPPPAPAPAAASASPLLYVAMAFPLLGFAVYHCWATHCLDKK